MQIYNWLVANSGNIVAVFVVLQIVLGAVANVTGNPVAMRLGTILGEIIQLLQKLFPTHDQLKAKVAFRMGKK